MPTYEPKVDPQLALRNAFLSGHTLNVDPTLTLQRTLSLQPNEPITRKIWESWRASDQNYDFFLQMFHKRSDAIDDSYGPATEALTQIPRCPIPDVPLPPAKDLNLDALGFESQETLDLWKHLQQVDFSSSQWPRGCISPSSHASKLDYSDRYAISIYLDTSGISSQWKANLPKITQIVPQIYAEMGIVFLYYIDGVPANGLGPNLTPKQCEIHKTFGPIPGGVIGFNYFPQNTCNVTIIGKLDSTWNVSLDGHISLEWHEDGHGVGLSHTRGGVMNPSVLFGLPYTFVNDTSFSAMLSKYGGKKVSLLPLNTPTPIPPTPPIDVPVANGVFYWNGSIYDFQIDNFTDLEAPNGVFNWQNNLLGIKITNSNNVMRN